MKAVKLNDRSTLPSASLFIIQVATYPGFGVQVAIRNTMEEMIELRDDLKAYGYGVVDIKEITSDGSVIEHPLVDVKYGDPLGLQAYLL
jgi:hypothetical protein